MPTQTDLLLSELQDRTVPLVPESEEWDAKTSKGFSASPYASGYTFEPRPLMHWVGDNLYQGGFRYSANLPRHIKHVVNMTMHDSFAGAEDRHSYLHVPMHDSTNPNRIDFDLIEDAARWVNARRDTGDVLVHCDAGLNRSGIVVARAIMLDEDAPADAVITSLRDLRDSYVLCNSLFEAWLRSFDFDAWDCFDRGFKVWRG